MRIQVAEVRKGIPEYVEVIGEEEWGPLGSQGYLDQAGMMLGGNLTPDMLAKAVTVGFGTDAASFTNARALQLESLESQLISSTIAMDDFRLWRAMPKASVLNTLDQFNVRTSHGSRWGHATAEAGTPLEQAATIYRRIAEMGYYRESRAVSDVSKLINAQQDPEAVETASGIMNVMANFSYDMFWGNRAALPYRIDGAFNALTAAAGSVVVDMEGAELSDLAIFDEAFGKVRTQFGRTTHVFHNPLIAADIAGLYRSAERIGLGTNAPNVTIGNAPTVMNSVFGEVKLEYDPTNLEGWTNPVSAEGDASLRPAVPNAAAPVAAGSGGSIPAGDYNWGVRAVNESGASATLNTIQVTCVGNDAVTLTIADPLSGGAPTGYEIYRSAKNGTTSDMRFQTYVARTGVSTVWVDDNSWIPGCSHSVGLDLRNDPSGLACQVSQLLPIAKKPLPITISTIPFGVIYYATIRWAVPQKHFIVKNILPGSVSRAGWAPV